MHCACGLCVWREELFVDVVTAYVDQNCDCFFLDDAHDDAHTVVDRKTLVIAHSAGELMHAKLLVMSRVFKKLDGMLHFVFQMGFQYLVGSQKLPGIDDFQHAEALINVFDELINITGV